MSSDEVIYLKADGETASAFEQEGLAPFTYAKKPGRQTVMSYRRMPDRCYDDPEELARWALRACAAANRKAVPAKTAKPSRKGRQSGAEAALDERLTRRPNAGRGIHIVSGIGIGRARSVAPAIAGSVRGGDGGRAIRSDAGERIQRMQPEAKDDDDDAKPVPGWKRFAWEAACIEVSGELTAIYQKQRRARRGFRSSPTRQGTVTQRVGADDLQSEHPDRHHAADGLPAN